MANQAAPNDSTASADPWFARLRASGKLLVVGAVVGIVATFLPLLTVSIQVTSPFALLAPMYGLNPPRSAMVVDDWRGKVCLLAYIAALLLAFMLYPRGGLHQKSRSWASVGVGLVTAALAIWMLISTSAAGNANLMPMAAVTVTTGIGAVLNAVASAFVTVGGFLKAREEKLI